MEKWKKIIIGIGISLGILIYTLFIIFVTQSLIKDNITKRAEFDKKAYEKTISDLELQLDDIKKQNEERDLLDSILLARKEKTITGTQNIKPKYDLERKKLQTTSFDTLAKLVARKVSDYQGTRKP